jgi:hypothetical protein
MTAILVLAGIVVFAAICLLIRDGLNWLFGWNMKLTLFSPPKPPAPEKPASPVFMYPVVYPLLTVVTAGMLFALLVVLLWILKTAWRIA